MISLHYPSDRVTRFRCANTIIYIQGISGSYGYRSLEIIYYIKDIQTPTEFRPRIISDTCTSEKLYGREIKMYFYLANVGFKPTPTSTTAPSITETTVIPSRPLRSLKRSYHGQGLRLISQHYPSDRVTRFRCANTIIYMGHYQKKEKSVSYTIFSHPQLQLSSFSVYNS